MCKGVRKKESGRKETEEEENEGEIRETEIVARGPMRNMRSVQIGITSSVSSYRFGAVPNLRDHKLFRRGTL